MRSQAAVGRRHEEAAVCHGEGRQGKQKGEAESLSVSY